MLLSKTILTACLLISGSELTPLMAQASYQKPPAEILKTLNAELPARSFLSPRSDKMILGTPIRYPSIKELSAPYYRLAGVRVTPHNKSLHSSRFLSGLVLVDTASGQQKTVKVPSEAHIGSLQWSADGKYFAFTNDTDKGVELWIGQADSGAVRRLDKVQVNRILDRAVVWMPDQQHLLVKLVDPNAGKEPADTEVFGPSIQESLGRTKASSTYEVRDVLKNPHDEKLFEYYGRSQLALVDVKSGSIKNLGKPALFTKVDPAPDGEHILVQSIHRPFSYVTTYNRFPTNVEVWKANGQAPARIASLPLVERVPIHGVQTGPRSFQWRGNEPATLVYVEALDGGESLKKASPRDRLMVLRAPFQGAAQEIYKTEQRLVELSWGEQKDMAVATEYDAISHMIKVSLIDIDTPQMKPQVLENFSSDDVYSNPGEFVRRAQKNGRYLIHQDGDRVFLSGQGSSPEGDRPFLDALNIKTMKKERLFRSDRGHLEHYLGWVGSSTQEFLTRRESAQEFPNYFVHKLTQVTAKAPAGEAQWSSRNKALTQFQDPLPALRGITKQIVKYKRADGVDLSFTLYLPAGHQKGTRLPTVLWAYPLDYSDAKVAGQVTGSTQEFTMPGWPLQLFFLQAGYAVIDDASIPVIGDTNKIYDNYMEQLIAGAEAAVNKAVDMGVTDRNRIGVMGHSHGGLMTVNLLAHTNMFKAGIARSGAYNRSLTAFGFQNETRTVWEAPEVYQKVSPFFVADKIKKPLLLIHGAADANPGTETMQSEKLYEAVRGNGGTVRLVRLPFESHGYQARESIEHVVWESLQWFDTYVKNPETRDDRQASQTDPENKG
ncbi:MAG TPA: prolyl oligopeptidase family serine peptidase [Oligoflexus sp.]|uniref:S9 family peptidase n=1 Tax=Oligoflexus sp. TaxID=1971216 RepID=UPI002D376EDC|nr:prolyl oligopeptidase family serine peptidase [Oligoflexus sp.]HYX35253.1 prolyl oligopeptidase family serine peptidase [Oligoflexus sp.]